MGYSKFVASAFIKAVSYDGERLRVTMHNGSVYDYPGVTAAVANEVINARSKGAAYNREIRGRYIVRKVRGSGGVTKV